jgi:hypothetical protein
MTSTGCQKCPAEDVISPLRNVAVVLAIFVMSLFWFWYSWSPFFPSVGAYTTRMVLYIYNNLTSKSSKQTSKILEFIFQSIASIQRLRPLQYFKIFVSYLQVMSSFLGFHVAWPSSIVSVTVWCKVIFNFNLLSLPGISCLWKGLGYNSKLMIYTLIPLVIGIMLWMPVILISILNLKCAKRSLEEQLFFARRNAIVQDRFWNALMFLCFMVHS